MLKLSHSQRAAINDYKVRVRTGLLACRDYLVENDGKLLNLATGLSLALWSCGYLIRSVKR